MGKAQGCATVATLECVLAAQKSRLRLALVEC